MGAFSSQGDSWNSHCLSLSLAHTPFITYPRVSFDVSVLTRTEGDKTQPLIKRQEHSEKQSQIWSQASLGSCHFMENGGQNIRLPPACAPALTNQTSPSLLLCLLSCFHLAPYPSPLFRLLLSGPCFILRRSGADRDWPAQSKALSYYGRWWGWGESQISQGRSLTLNFSIRLSRMVHYLEKDTESCRTQVHYLLKTLIKGLDY